VFVLNWDKEPATIDLGVALPDGTYEMFMRDETGWSSVFSRATAAQLREFRVAMNERKAMVFYVRELKASR
jgi:hypothetical protein